MSRERHHPPTRSGANASLSAKVPALEPVSPLPRAAEAYVPPGSYGVGGPHVPVTPYVPPLPPNINEDSPSSALRVVTEDPLAFLAAQAAAHTPTHDQGQAPVAGNRFRPSGDAERRPTEQRRTSVPPPGFR